MSNAAHRSSKPKTKDESWLLAMWRSLVTDELLGDYLVKIYFFMVD